MADVVDASVVHLVTRPVDTSQQPPQPSQRERVPLGGAGNFTANMMGAQQFGVPMDINDFGSVGLGDVRHQCPTSVQFIRVLIATTVVPKCPH